MEQGFPSSQLTVDELLQSFKVTLRIDWEGHGVNRLVALNAYLTDVILAFRKLQLREDDDMLPEQAGVRCFRDLYFSTLYVSVEIDGLVISSQRPQ